MLGFGEDAGKYYFRLWIGFLSNMLSLFLIAYAFALLGNDKSENIYHQYIKPCILSFSLFGIIRIVHSLVACEFWELFYSEKEIKKIFEQYGRAENIRNQKLLWHLTPGVLIYTIPIITIWNT
ncbi:hypothetical protein CH365_12960 [Leptospira neocaledonica]|uniref:Uncharacterized protein n=2 Tax=Leptospira neocaledonica TaxID=2023192 RepID=A0A2M9ZW48_9LEPT|nr:hypothetical protein CH365_12960 [Leptospira neocaledonica]